MGNEISQIKLKVKQAVNIHMQKQLQLVCDALVVDALRKRNFISFTGNTLTSFSCGLYLDGSLVYVVEAGDSLRAPIRKKVNKGKVVRLKNPYEGEERSVKGRVKVDDMYGQETSMSFLSKYKAPKKGFAIVMTTGTEYSEYLESARKLNVLTDTFKSASDTLFNTVKPIP